MGELIPIFGMVTGIITMGVLGITLVKVFNGPVGQALARKLHRGGGEADPEELDALHERIERLEERVVETEERLHFAERLLAARSGAGAPDHGGG